MVPVLSLTLRVDDRKRVKPQHLRAVLGTAMF
ncbi:MAG: hypothetical protein RL710_3077 [Pseudomonadota bacterium]|jgi:hypothetical protein